MRHQLAKRRNEDAADADQPRYVVRVEPSVSCRKKDTVVVYQHDSSHQGTHMFISCRSLLTFLSVKVRLGSTARKEGMYMLDVFKCSVCLAWNASTGTHGARLDARTQLVSSGQPTSKRVSLRAGIYPSRRNKRLSQHAADLFTSRDIPRFYCPCRALRNDVTHTACDARRSQILGSHTFLDISSSAG